IFINDSRNESAVLSANKWNDIYGLLKDDTGRATITRKTNETAIEIKLNLYGSGKSNISTGLPFFDHMLDQLARHGNIDLEIDAAGDLEIDEHHTIEDVAITLGEAFKQALGS